MKGKKYEGSEKALRVIALLIAGGVVSIVLFNTPASDFLSFFKTSSIGILVAGASTLVGGLLGFLFGIPRTLQKETDFTGPEGDSNTVTNTGRQVVSYRANTNLEQISDWLTKILVGVGLTQLNVIPSKLQSLSDFVAQGLGGATKPSVLASAILVFYVICGFLYGYLWTRLYLPTALKEADLGSLAEKLERTDKKLSEIEKQNSRDAKAWSLVQLLLNPSPNVPEIKEEKLIGAIIGASSRVKTTIFHQAWDIRSTNWRDAAKKPIMERTIPIFRALIESDVQHEYHMNHGQLGFALKDKRNPDFAEAETELTKAIEIRDNRAESGWQLYEFNRAICRIELEKTISGVNSHNVLKECILADLKTASQNPELRELIKTDQKISTWMRKHKIDFQEIFG